MQRVPQRGQVLLPRVRALHVQVQALGDARGRTACLTPAPSRPSLACCRAHKVTHECTGKRIRTQPVASKAALGEVFEADYHFLAEVDAVTNQHTALAPAAKRRKFNAYTPKVRPAAFAACAGPCLRPPQSAAVYEAAKGSQGKAGSPARDAGHVRAAQAKHVILPGKVRRRHSGGPSSLTTTRARSVDRIYWRVEWIFHDANAKLDSDRYGRRAGAIDRGPGSDESRAAVSPRTRRLTPSSAAC